MSKTDETLIAYLQSEVQAAGLETQVKADTQLLELGMLDSIGLVGLIAFIEKAFSIQLADDEVAPEIFETPATISAFIENKTKS